MINKSNKILQVKNLRQHFRVGSGKKRIDVKAVDGVTFDVYEKEVFGLVGESGCGKTTTGRSIIKLYKPTDGTVKFNGKIIGAGYSGNIRRIKKAKRDSKLEIIKTDDYRYAKYLIKQDYKKKKRELKFNFKGLKAKFKSDIEDVHSFNNNINVEIEAEKNAAKLKISEIRHESIIKIDKINSSKGHEIEHYYKITMDAAKTRLNQKIGYLSDAIISKEEKTEQKEMFIADFELEKANIEDEYLEGLEKYNFDNYLKQARKIYSSRIKNSDDKNKINELENKLVNLDSKAQNLDYKELTKAEKKAKVSKVLANERQMVAKIKEEEVKKIELLLNKLKTKEELQPQLDKLREQFEKDKKANKIAKHNLIIKRKEQLTKLKEDKKDNPESFKVDIDKQKESRVNLREIIKAEKQGIKELKKLNKIIETEEETKEKALEVERINNKYLPQIKVLEDKIELLETKETKKSTSELKKLQTELKELKIEKKLELTNAINRYSYAGVMSNLQMIFQDPVSSLNPRQTVKEIISEGLIIQGIKDQHYIDRKVSESLNLVGLSPNHASRYPHEFSGGQRQRIGIARALIVNPKFIIADEPISALDVSIQAQIINLLKDLREELGLTILFIAHDLSVVKYFSDRIAVMYFGKIVELTTTEELFAHPLHPYTKSLLSAIPNPDPKSEQNRKRTTYDPRKHNYSVDKPEMTEIKPGHFIYANKAEIKVYKKELKGGR